MNHSALPPLYTQNPLRRFSDRADDYARYRPTYPAEAIDQILAGLPAPSALTIADIGAGTGISARLLGDRGAAVWAIEPNPTMRESAQPHPQVQFRAGTAEQTELPDRSVDLITCCQAFHWFEAEAALHEFCRILKPGGRVALMWNDRDLQDPLTSAYTEVVRRAADRQFFERPDRKSARSLEASPLFQNYREYSCRHRYALNLAGLVGLTLSASYVPKSGPAYDQLLIDLQSLYQQWSVLPAAEPETPGVDLSYQTKVYLAERPL